MGNFNCSFFDCDNHNQRIYNEWEKYSLSDNKISIIDSNSNNMVFIV